MGITRQWTPSLHHERVVEMDLFLPDMAKPLKPTAKVKVVIAMVVSRV